MFDIGIFGLWYGVNYGSQITYYALNKVLKREGYSTVMIANPLSPNASYGENISCEGLPEWNPISFASRQGYKITPFYPMQDMWRVNSICKRFLIGADQMWNYYLSSPYKYSYFFDFVSDEKPKISYATSMGIDTYPAPKEYKEKVSEYLARFSALSVREDFSKELVRNLFHLEAEKVLDPVLLCTKDEYGDLIIHTHENYIFAYILDPNAELGEVLRAAVEKTNKDLYVVFDMAGNMEEQRKRLNVSDERIHFVDIPSTEGWISYYYNADFIITDSFHGTCFSLIFEIPFYSKRNEKRGGKRFDELISIAGIESRVFKTSREMINTISEVGLTDIAEFSEIHGRLDNYKEKSIAWLKNALLLEKIPEKSVSNMLNREMCVGCTACKSVCPVNAIDIRQDVFGYYRSYVDYEKCINCGKCAKVCPALNPPTKKNEKEPECYEFQTSEPDRLISSTSGGAFTLLAESVLQKGGYVAGVAWGSDLTAEHIIVDNSAKLELLKKSKYMQSRVGNCFENVKLLLDKDKKVLFSGTPCQVAGLKNFLGKEYDNLYLVDILCGNSPSSLFFKKYVEESFKEGVESYEFRYKDAKHGTQATSARIVLSSGDTKYVWKSCEDDYQWSYHSHLMCPKHCEKCQYQEAPRYGDITIGDFWGIKEHDSEAPAKDGISAVLINNKRGKKLFDSIPNDRIALKKLVPTSWLGGNGFAFGNHNWTSPKRDLFYEMIINKSFRESMQYALKPNHGQYRNLYKRTNRCFPLQYDSNMLHFKYEDSIWEEHLIGGKPTLFMKEKNVSVGHYAVLPLAKNLKKTEKYRILVRFKIKSQASEIHFHLKDSGSKLVQILGMVSLNGKNDGTTWNQFDVDFYPNSDYYDEFMIGATEVSGPNSFITFDYIFIYKR